MAQSIIPEKFEKFRAVIPYARRFKVSQLLEIIEKKNKTVSAEQIRALDIDSEDKYERFLIEYGVSDEVGKAEIEIRADPLLGEHTSFSSLISQERANKPLNIKTGTTSDKTLKERIENCDFCSHRRYTETALPWIKHLIDGKEILSVSNLCPFISPHYVTIFSEQHKIEISELEKEDVRIYLITGREIAEKLKQGGYHGMWDFINWGKLAGMSQEHPHAQRGALYKIIKTQADKEFDSLKKRAKDTGAKSVSHYLEEYIGSFLSRESQYFMGGEKYAVAYTAFAPKFSGQVDIMLKRKGASNYSNLTDEEIDEVSGLIINVLHRLAKKRNMKNFNLITHQSRFDNDGEYRMHFHVYPRDAAIAGMELEDLPVVSAYPENLI